MNEALTEDFWCIQLPNDPATSAARSPSLFAYYAALCLLDACALFSDLKVSDLIDPAVKANRSAVERHHLCPRAYLKTLGIVDDRQVNQIANFALIEWQTNSQIGDRAPSEYFPELANRVSAEAASLHALPDGWEEMPYEVFLERRRRLMAQVIRAGFARLA